MKNPEPTVIASYIKSLLRTLNTLNINFINRVPDCWKQLNTDSRIPLSQVNEFWNVLVTSTGRKDLGLQAALHIHPSSFHILGQLAYQCSSVGQAWEQAIQYYGLVSEAGVLTSTRDQEQLILTFTPHDVNPTMTPQQLEAMMGSLVRYSKLIAGDDFSIAAAEFCHQPQASDMEYQGVFACPVKFGCDRNRLLIANEELTKPVPLASQSLMSHHLNLVRESVYFRRLERLTEEELNFRIYSYLKSFMPGPIPSLDACANYLHMSSSTLKRKLKNQGSSYSAIVMQVRKNQVLQLLDQGQISISEISHYVGFKSSASFYRCFKQWTDMTPEQYRRRNDVQPLINASVI